MMKNMDAFVSRRVLGRVLIHATVGVLMGHGLAFGDHGPAPMGLSTVSVSYPTGNGLETYSGQRDYTGTGPFSATNLGTAPNIAAFNSAGDFGRRVSVSQNPAYANVIHADETPMTHAFFKKIGNEAADFFPGIVEGGAITLNVQNIQFDRPVYVDEDTLLLHVLWNDQNKLQEHPYHHIHNIHTASETFRDLDDFLAAGEMAEHPMPNFTLGEDDIDWVISGAGTNTLSIMATFPYDRLRNLEAGHQHGELPPGLPAPHGFLEPFHFHIEYTVTPEPGTLALLVLSGCLCAFRRRKRSSV